MNINEKLTIEQLLPKVKLLWEHSAHKIRRIEKEYDPALGAPVFTRAGKYTTRGWTEWTQGFQYGSSILQFDATGEEEFLDMGRKATVDKMSSHVGHFGVHDHGFNNVSTYGNLLRLMKEGKIPQDDWEQHFYEIALKLSGAVQAKRWTSIPDGGYIYSFNGPHSLFVDTIRTVRAVMVSHELDFAIWDENDRRISLLERGIQHAIATAQYAIYYGEGRDSYDEWGRTAHESVFNTNDGNYRCPNAQQGFSGFTTWTRGLAWAIAGYPEQLEYLKTLSEEELAPYGGFSALETIYLKAAKATCDFYIDNTPTDGIPYWDTGAPGLSHMAHYLENPADPFGAREPVDSSAAAIAAQGFIRLGTYLKKEDAESARRYIQTGLKMLSTLLETPYLSEDPDHQGLLLHSIYHQPNGWDHTPAGSQIPYGESCMWGDYHLRELALYVLRIAKDETYYTFF